MLKVFVSGEPLDVGSDFCLDIEETNPIYNDRGSMSLPVTAPHTPHNARLFGPTFLTNSIADPNANTGTDNAPVAVLTDGAYSRAGLINFISNSREGLEFNIGLDNSVAYAKWKSKKLRELSAFPGFAVGSPTDVYNNRWGNYGANKPTYLGDHGELPVAVFPITVAIPSDTSIRQAIYGTLAERLNMTDNNHNILEQRTVTREIDSTVTAINTPAGYGITYFLRVWKIIEWIFADLGVELVNNPFKSNDALYRLVVLNNTADAYTKPRDGGGTSPWGAADFLPDCTVEEFLQALWVRFGLTYELRFDLNTARLALARDVLRSEPGIDVTTMATGTPTTTYMERKYMRLSARNSIEGAAPPSERFSDILGGQDPEPYLEPGANPRLWFDLYGWWTKMTGTVTTYIGTSFFVHDPALAAAEAEELTSEDEWVPLGTNGDPHYLFGSRHAHTIIQGGDEEKETSTPLAFMFAVKQMNGTTRGQLHSWAGDADPAERQTLLFEFSHGLYATYWREFDKLAYYTPISIEVPIRMTPAQLSSISMLTPVLYRGVRCLIDKMDYTLPSRGREIDVHLTLRPAMHMYDVGENQKIYDVGNWA